MAMVWKRAAHYTPIHVGLSVTHHLWGVSQSEERGTWVTRGTVCGTESVTARLSWSGSVEHKGTGGTRQLIAHG